MLKNLLKKVFITKREKMAIMVLNGIISADWNMPIPEGRTWDEMAIERAYSLTDQIIKNG